MSLAANMFVIWTQPNCSFCDKAKALILAKGFPYTTVDITEVSPETKVRFVDQFEPKHRTVPKVYFNGALIGGFTELEQWFATPDGFALTSPAVYPPLQIKRITPTAIIPTRGSPHAIGFDVYADLRAIGESISIHPNEVQRIATGIAVKPPPGHYIRIAPRSGLAAKHGIDTLAGVVDEDYRGELSVVLTTHDHKTFYVNHGDRIAQLILERATITGVEIVDSLDDTARGAGGFGSTG